MKYTIKIPADTNDWLVAIDKLFSEQMCTLVKFAHEGNMCLSGHSTET